MVNVYFYDKETKVYSGSLSGSPDIVIGNAPKNNFTLTPIPDYRKAWRWLEVNWWESLPKLNYAVAQVELISLAPFTPYKNINQWVELLPINNPDMPYDDTSIWDSEINQWVDNPELLAYKHLENQRIVWELIKERRQEKITAGVYIPSIDKHFHTDETSVALYTNIGNSIALGVFKPLNWKTMEGAFVELTETLFIEVHVAIINNTESIYAKAEWHKYMMMQADEPSEYDYIDGW